MTTHRSMEIAQEALASARAGQSAVNEAIVITGFMERGVPEADIEPRQNCLTYHAWRALGRTVRKGEHGVRITTWIAYPERRDADTDEVTRPAGKSPKTVSVFHISQTKALS